MLIRKVCPNCCGKIKSDLAQSEITSDIPVENLLLRSIQDVPKTEKERRKIIITYEVDEKEKLFSYVCYYCGHTFSSNETEENCPHCGSNNLG